MPSYTFNGKTIRSDAPLSEAELEEAFASVPMAQPATKTTESTNYKKTVEEMPWYEQLAAGAGGAAVGTILALKQLLGREPSAQEIDEYKQSMAALRSTGAGFGGEVLGNIAQLAIPAGAISKAPVIGGLLRAGGVAKPIAGAALASATEGGLAGALTPISADESRIANIGTGALMGGAVGGGVGGLLAFTKPAGQYLKTLFSQKGAEASAGRAMAKAAGENVDDVVAALKKSPSNLSASEAVAEAKIVSPEFAGLQDVASQFNPTPALRAEKARMASRLGAIKGIAGGDWRAESVNKSLQSAVKRRQDVADAMYQKAFSADDARIAALRSKYSGGIAQAKAPVIDPRVQAIANNKTIADAAQAVRRSYPEAGEPMMGIRGLHFIKKVIDDDISAIRSGKQTALSNINEAQLLNAKNKLVETLDSMSPAYKSARIRYQKMSKPIDRMIVGQELGKALENVVEGRPETAQAFFRAVDVAPDSMTRKVLGYEYEKLSDLLTPQQMQVIERVRKDLTATAAAKEAGSRGAARQAREVGEGINLPRLLNRGIAVANSVFDKIFGAGKARTLDEIAEIMQDPARSAIVMQKASQKEIETINRMITAARTAGLYGAASGRAGILGQGIAAPGEQQ